MKKEKFERIVNFRRPFDKRHEDPNKSYGIGSMSIWFILKGEKGAVQVMINTPLYLPKTVDEYKRIGNKNKTPPCDLRDSDGKAKGLECYDVGYHAFRPIMDWQNKSNKQDCKLSPTGYCWYDGSSLRGGEDKIVEMMLEYGDDAIWKYLEKYYYDIFVEQSEPGGKNEKV